MDRIEISQRHIQGLDGVRALAILAVVSYHLWPPLLPGGFIGVDVFFVLSGYLITRSFRSDPNRPVGMRLSRFWRHRARRILPPLLPVVAVTAVFAALIGDRVLPGLWMAVLSAVTFSSNWVAIAQSTSYFASTSAHPLQHLWSLAVEEQFYMFWPLLLLAIGLLSPRTRAWVPVGIAALSAVAMAALYVPGTDPTPLYVGTGTHLFGLALGAALALSAEQQARRTAITAALRLTATLIGLISLSILAVAALVLGDEDVVTYRGGLLTVSLTSAALIWSLTRGAPGIGRLLQVRPLRALGQRSYAVYLWHWPILVLLAAAIDPRNIVSHVAVWAGTVILTVLLASASWRWVEQPIMRIGWRATARGIIRSKVRLRYPAIIAATLLTIGTGTACLASTRPSDAEQLITTGERYLHTQPNSRANDSSPTTTPPPTRQAFQPNTALPSGPRIPNSTPGEFDVTKTPISAIGDSVMLAAAPALKATFPHITIDAKVSRQPDEVVPILRDDVASGHLADTVLVGIGTNGALGNTLRQIRLAIGPSRTLIIVTAHGDRPWIPHVNETIRAFAATDALTRVAHWNRAISNHENLLASDGIHPGDGGSQIYVHVLIQAMQD